MAVANAQALLAGVAKKAACATNISDRIQQVEAQLNLMSAEPLAESAAIAVGEALTHMAPLTGQALIVDMSTQIFHHRILASNFILSQWLHHYVAGTALAHVKRIRAGNPATTTCWISRLAGYIDSLRLLTLPKSAPRLIPAKDYLSSLPNNAPVYTFTKPKYTQQNDDQLSHVIGIVIEVVSCWLKFPTDPVAFLRSWFLRELVSKAGPDVMYLLEETECPTTIWAC
jgi:hypothetical protein